MANELEECSILRLQTQALFTVRFFDRFGNPSEFLPASAVFPPPVVYHRKPYYDNESSSGTISLLRTGFASARASVAERFPKAGEYLFAITAMTSTTAQCMASNQGVAFSVKETPGFSCIPEDIGNPGNIAPYKIGNVPIGSATIATFRVNTYTFPTSLLEPNPLLPQSSTAAVITFTAPFNNGSAALLSFTGEPGSFTSTSLSTTASAGNSIFRVWVRMTPKANGVVQSPITATAQTGLAAAGYETLASETFFEFNALTPAVTTNTTTIDFGSGFNAGEPLVRSLVVSLQYFTTSTLRVTPPTGFALGLSSTGTFSTLPLDVDVTAIPLRGATPLRSGSITLWVQYAPSAGASSGMLSFADPRTPATLMGSVNLLGTSSALALSPARLAFGADEMTTFTDDKTYTISHSSSAPITVELDPQFSIVSVMGASSTATAGTPPSCTLTPSAASGTISVVLRFTTTKSTAPLTDRHTTIAPIIHTQSGGTQTLTAIGTRLPSTCATCAPAQNVTFLNDRFVVNGKDFFPLGWYGGATQIRFGADIPSGNVIQPYWNEIIDNFFAQANINGVRRGPLTPYEFIAATRLFLNGLAAHNKRGIIHVPTIDRFAGAGEHKLMENATAENIDIWAKVIAADPGIRNHSAMLGWYTADEPEIEATNLSTYLTDAYKHSLVNFRSLSKLRTSIREADPLHPVFVVVASNLFFRKLFVPGAPECIGCNDGTQYFDVLMQDNYLVIPCFPSPSPRLGGILDDVSLLRDGYTDVRGTAENLGSTIFVTQGYGDVYDSKFAWDEYGGKLRTPTFDEMRYAIMAQAFGVQDAISSPLKARHSMGGALFWYYSLTGANATVRTNAAQAIAYMHDHVATIIGKQRPTTAVLSATSLQPMIPPSQSEGAINPIFREDNTHYYLILVNSLKGGMPLSIECQTSYNGSYVDRNGTTQSISGTYSFNEYRSRKNFVDASIMPEIQSDFRTADIEMLTTSGMSSSWTALAGGDYNTMISNGQSITRITGSTPSNLSAGEVRIFRLRKGTRVTLLALGKEASLSTVNNGEFPQEIHQSQEKELVDGNAYIQNAECIPNPAQNEAQLSFILAKADNISIRLYDALGREVLCPLNNQALAQGQHSVPLRLHNLAAGIYQCRIITALGTFSVAIVHHQ